MKVFMRWRVANRQTDRLMALGSPRVHTREQTEKRPAVKQQIKGCRYWKLARRGRAACSDPPTTDPPATQAHAIPEVGASKWGADDEVVPAENAPQPPYSWGDPTGVENRGEPTTATLPEGRK